MNWYIRCRGSRRILFAIIGAFALVTFVGRAKFITRADSSQKPQATGFAGDVTQNSSLNIDGALVGAHLGSNGSPVDFSSPVRAHAVVVGDFNGDGVPDVAIGAPDQTVQPASGPARSQAGAVYIIFGANNLLGTPGSPHTIDTNSSGGMMTIIGANAGDHLGFSVAAGDVNGDGTNDLVIGAPGFSANNTTRVGCGAAFVVFGGHAASSGLLDLATANAADIQILGINQGDQFGSSVAVGDVGGLTSDSAAEQGIADILVGAPHFAGPNVNRPDAGGAFVMFGGTKLNRVGGTTTVLDLTSDSTPADVEIVGAASGDLLGTAIAAGDINLSLPQDIVVGAPNATRPTTSGVSGLPNTGAAYAIFGGQNLNPTAGLPRIFDMGAGDQSISIFGNAIGDRTGASLAIGDVTGDNNADLVIGAPNANGPAAGPRSACGDVFVIPGSVNLNSTIRIDLSLALTDPANPANKVVLTVFGGLAGDHLGSSVGLGNFNISGFADNILDLLIGAPGANSGAGQVSVIFGGANLTTLGATRDIQLDQDDIRVVGKSSVGGGLSSPLILRENLASTNTRQTPQLLDVTATVNSTSFTETNQVDFQSGTLTGVAAGPVGGGDLELMGNPGLRFTGGMVTVPNSSLLQPGTGSWTVEFWLNSVTAPGSGLAPVIGSRTSYINATDLGWGVAVDTSSHLHLLMGDGASGFDLASSSAVTSSATPQHWAVVFDRSTTSVTFYLNGALDVTRSIPPGGAPSGINQLNTLLMGSDGAAQTLTGTLDDVRIYNIARTGSAIAGDYADELTGSVPNLNAYWKFNDTQPTTTVVDSSGHSNNGTLSGNVAFTTATGRFLSAGNRVSPPINTFTGISSITGTSLSWTANTPSGTTVGVDASVNGGSTFIHAVNGGPIPGVGTGDALGWAVAAADLNNDQAGDLILGAPGVNTVVSSDSRTQSGAVYVIAGTVAAPPPPPPNQNHPPSVTVTAPVGGETLLVGHQFNITWSATDPEGDNTIKNFEVDISTDSGATFGVIVGALDGTTRSYTWTVPNGLQTNHARIRVIATDDQSATGSGESPADFTISDTGIGVTLTSPLGGQTYVFGQQVTVTWTVAASDQPFVSGFDLLMSTDGGLTFSIRVANGPDPAKPAIDAGASSFLWTVPSMCTTNAKMLIVATSTSGHRTSSSSPNPFTIQDVGPTVDTSNMKFPKDPGQIKITVTSVGGQEVLFQPGVTVEISSDRAGTQFFMFSSVKVKGGGHKLITKGTIDGMKPIKFFPIGDTRVMRITNPVCGVTLLTVTRKKTTLVAQ